VPIELLDARRAQALRRAPITYPHTASESPSRPDGYRHLRRERLLPNTTFDTASTLLARWQIHAGAGLHVAASSREVGLDEVVVLTLGVRHVGVHAPCRVVQVIDEPDRRGFVYCTLPGHPESGEESFLIERRDDGTTWFTIEASSRPSARLARLGGPVTRRIQLALTNRYLRAAG
jgi:uncharacterized protein (UPF0548 family)